MIRPTPPSPTPGHDRGDQPPPDHARQQLSTFLDLLFADDVGYIHCPTLRRAGRLGRIKPSWRENHFKWPKDRERTIDWILEQNAAGLEVYITPYILATEKRTKGTAVSRHLVHADFDGSEFDHEKLARLGGFAIASGSPGHFHVYVPLTRAVSADDHTALCRGLKTYIGAKDSKINDNDVLRPPGTHNHKDPDNPQPVHVWGTMKPQPQDPSQLADILGVSLGGPVAGLDQGDRRTHRFSQGEGGGVCVRPSPSANTAAGHGLSREFQDVLSTTKTTNLKRPGGSTYPTRSDALQGVALHAMQRGLTYEQFLAQVTDSRNASSSWRRPHELPTAVSQAWEAARLRAEALPPIRTREEALELIQYLQQQARRPWPGRGGATQWVVLNAILDVALSLGRIEFDFSLRDLAQHAGCAVDTARRALKFLAKEGWLQEVHPGSPRGLAARYRLLVPNRVLADDELVAISYTSIHDYWAAVGSSAKHIFDGLTGGSATVNELVARSGRTPQTVRRQLQAFERDGLARRTPDVIWEIDPSGDLDAVADSHGFSGKLASRAAQYAREREARSAWQVQNQHQADLDREVFQRARQRYGQPGDFGVRVGDLRQAIRESHSERTA
ncbi:hypothetical protein [Humibacillus xanthopallidus]|uniref:hypothetical protein n=1 Tax=Humibacillus xanthopallidus TaxID=412689 RepID=UPI00384CE7A8